MKLKKGRILPIKEEKTNALIIKTNKKKCTINSRHFYEKNRNFLNVNLEPIYDKNFLSFCLKEVELFLQKNGYKKKIPEISSYHYKNKEIFQIIFFLFKKIDKNYRIITLPEDNILSTLKILGYPIFLTKSTLVSPINPRSHQILFHCLNWVIELCLYDTRVIFENQAIYSTDLKKLLIWNRMVKSYNRFLSKKRSTDNFKKILKITLANLLKPEKKKKMKW